MKRWVPAFVATLIACVPVVLSHASTQNLLNDSDTRVLLEMIRQRGAPFSWFLGDWPLQNHFYRPIATLAFELDNRLYGNHAAGYGWTNDLLCIASILLLFWFVAELTRKPIFTGVAASLFASWHFGGFTILAPVLGAAVWALLVVGAIRHRTNLKLYVLPALAIPMLAHEVYGMHDLERLMIGWLPSRTASTMAVFALISLASYARYERLSALRAPEQAPTPLTPPATRNTIVRKSTTQPAGPWLLLCVGALVCSLACYEQGVMVPAALLGVAIYFSFVGYRPGWKWQGLFWGILGGYVLLRLQIVPPAPSHYQLQQFRHGPGVYLSLSDYALPVAGVIPGFVDSLDFGSGVVIALMNTSMYAFLLMVLETVAEVVVLKRQWMLALTGWALSIITYLPMAWLKQFDHYHYLPMAMRSIFVTALGWAVWESSLIALRPQARQAPGRPVPAPGSLQSL